jgi:two-component system NtrC family sensor kinase
LVPGASKDTVAELTASVGQLVAGVAHELNTPLGSISSNAQLALKALDLVRGGIEPERLANDRRLARAVATLEQACQTQIYAAERVAAIVKSLRDFARPDEAGLQVADLHDCIRSTLTVLRHELVHGIAVELDLGEVPPILCNPSQINQVLMNLLVNAKQSITPPGTILVRTRVEDDTVAVTIRDTGCGIAAEDQTRIFEPGFTTKGVGVGTGLGLAICGQIVGAHGGGIEVDSRLGEGSTFTVRLPLRTS